MEFEHKISRLEKSLEKFAADPDYAGLELQMGCNEGVWQVQEEKPKQDSLLPEKDGLYAIPKDRQLQRQIKYWLNEEKKARLVCNSNVLSLTEKVKGYANYIVGRPIDAPTITEAAKRQYHKLSSLHEKMDASFEKIEDNSERLESYLDRVIDKIIEHDEKFAESNQRRQKFNQDLDEHRQNIADAKGYSSQYGMAIKNYFHAQTHHLKATRDCITHLVSRNLRESEVNELKGIIDSTWAVLIRGAALSSHASVLSEHMRHVYTTYEVLSRSVQNIHEVDSYMQRTSDSLLRYKKIIETLKGLMVEQTKGSLSEEGRNIYKLSSPK